LVARLACLQFGNLAMKVPRHALLLAAGLGTRLLPLTRVRTKAAVPVAGVPLARRVVSYLVNGGVTDLVVNLHHLPETLTAVLGDGADLGARIRYSWEQPVVLGSAGGPRQALPLLGVDRFLIVNGDVLTNVDLEALAHAHDVSGALVTLALVSNREPLRYGGVQLDETGLVTGFVPRGPSASGSFHFVGPQVVQAEAFQSVPAGSVMNSIGGLYNQLMATRPGSVRGFVSAASYWDVGTIADYWATWWAFADPQSGASGRSILWNDVQVGAAAVLDECIVTDCVEVPPGAHYRRTVLVNAEDGSLEAFPFSLES
jgi:NDP-sugar pyrophosphorylase family protein